jgi:ABC-type Fe3+-siderophore transport system permease subunit
MSNNEHRIFTILILQSVITGILAVFVAGSLAQLLNASEPIAIGLVVAIIGTVAAMFESFHWWNSRARK